MTAVNANKGPDPARSYGATMYDIKKELSFLKRRGYVVGEVFVSPEGKMHVLVADRACAYEQVRMLVAMENMKSDATTIDSPALTALATLCGQVAAGGEVDSEIAAKASRFETEWRSLVGRGTPPPSSLKDKHALDTEGVVLAGRMVTFLACELQTLSVLTRAHTR